ncbi:hypothetical protein KSS87_007654 [Heliosperma pusillum]|nr:hypothetical protein KSS87_007654 [Heliosperma pusillum]
MVGSTHNPSPEPTDQTLINKLTTLRNLLQKPDPEPIRIVCIGAGAWGSVFTAMLQDTYGHLRHLINLRIWRRERRPVDRATAEHLFDVINSREHVLRRLLRRCAYLKYVEARLGDRTLFADEILKDGFCLNMIDTPICPLKVVTNLQEAVWDADIVINGLPSTETKAVFEEISLYWKERRSFPVIISLAKGIEAELEPVPRIITPTQLIHRVTGVPMENILYLGGPNIASEVYNKEYANARICGSEKWRKALALFMRQPHFIVWDNGDLVTHEVMGGLKNVYAIGADIFQFIITLKLWFDVAPFPHLKGFKGVVVAVLVVVQGFLNGACGLAGRGLNPLGGSGDGGFSMVTAALVAGRWWYWSKVVVGGMVAALTNESATSKSVYFAHCTSEMIFITHLLTEEPEKLAGPLLADTYVTLLKGRNALYGQMLAKGALSLDMGDSIKGKGTIQGVSAVKAFYELLSQPSISVLHPEEKKPVAPVELCPILKKLYSILITREFSPEAILQALRDETMNDPRERIEIAQSHAFYIPSLLGQ